MAYVDEGLETTKISDQNPLGNENMVHEPCTPEGLRVHSFLKRTEKECLKDRRFTSDKAAQEFLFALIAVKVHNCCSQKIIVSPHELQKAPFSAEEEN